MHVLELSQHFSVKMLWADGTRSRNSQPNFDVASSLEAASHELAVSPGCISAAAGFAKPIGKQDGWADGGLNFR